jgi:hypothetical protein
MNCRPAQETFKSLQTLGAGKLNPQELKAGLEQFKSLQSAEGGQLDHQELKAGSVNIQEPSNFRSWHIGFSRIEGWFTTHSRVFKLVELANWSLKN